MDPVRFAADAMLGRLARWLRVLAFDTTYDAGIADPDLVWQANAEDRILLTRDRHLLRDLRPLRFVEVRSDHPLQQLQDVVRAVPLGAPGGPLFSRCLLDNTPLPAPLPADAAARLLPHQAFEVPGSVRRCPGCGRLYWEGSHAKRMRAALQRALPQWPLA
jgi:uncharacterized protein with PIN domain